MAREIFARLIREHWTVETLNHVKEVTSAGVGVRRRFGAPRRDVRAW